MNPEQRRVVSLLIIIVMSGTAMADQTRPLHMKIYLEQGVNTVDQNKGRQLWYSTVNHRSCTDCHGDDPSKLGKHVKTGKLIQPMASSVNAERYQKGKKIEKWFLRNCKWTFGRQCSSQEKADILSWLSMQ